MYVEKPNNKALKATAGIVVILAVVMLTIVTGVSANNKEQAALLLNSPTTAPATTTSTETVTPTASTAPSAPATSSSYKDGTYTATKEYYVPNGYENIKLTVKIQSGVITDSGVVSSQSDRESRKYQRDFAVSYKTKVVGKNISDLNLSTVAGASLTTQAFNDSINDIQNQAKV